MILIACEFSGRIRDEFIKLGFDAWSCDLLEGEGEYKDNHIKGDVLDILNDPWQLIIAHPPCTHLAVSGARWFEEKRKDGRQQSAINFFMKFINANCSRICVENPVSIMSTVYRRPDQIIQPWQYGHGETKATCLWLKGLPKLVPTNIVSGRQPRIHYIGPSENRSKLRSITYQGVASAIVEQWSVIL